jgi:fumarylpyruvate hydrolase
MKMTYAISPPPIPTLPIEGVTDRFPVGRIFCVGRNYADHAREMGDDPNREPPFFFMKPGSAILPEGFDFPYPALSQNVHYEFELVVAIGIGGANIPATESLKHIYGYAAGLDMTRRDLQDQAKSLRRPWEAGKSFDHSAPCSRIMPAVRIGHPNRGSIRLDVNGKRAQDSDISALIWKIPEIVAELSKLFTLAPGDLIFTGTPAGVGPVQRGDILNGSVEGVVDLTVRVV